MQSPYCTGDCWPSLYQLTSRPFSFVIECNQYCGAEAYDQIDKEKDTLVAQLLVEKEHRARLEQTLLDQVRYYARGYPRL